MIADAVTPAGQPDGPSDIGFAQSAAGVGTVTVHRPGPVAMGRREVARARQTGRTSARCACACQAARLVLTKEHRPNRRASPLLCEQ